MKKLILPIALSLVVGLVVGIASMGGLSRSRPAAAENQPAAAPVQPAGTPSAGPMIEDPKAVYLVTLDKAPVRGPSDALITIVAWSDFECPFCKRGELLVKELEQAYPGKIRLAYKQNPLSMHAQALPAALLAEAVRAKRGDAAFWKAHDALFAMSSLSADALKKLGAEYGVTSDDLQLAEEYVRRDQALAQSLGAYAAPTFFVNGRKIVGVQPIESFKAVIDEELKRAEALAGTGVPRSELYARLVEKGAIQTRYIPGPAQPAPAAPSPAAPAGQSGKVALRADDAIRGPAVAPVTVVLFSDFQCPFCSKVGPTLKQIEQSYPGKVRFAWKHLPLPFHAQALPAARAAEAARLQGKFWEMHDRLFTDQATLSDAVFEKQAQALGLDLARFKKDQATDATAARIAEDGAAAASVGATGTPTLFVNCRKLVGAQPFEAFKAIIDDELRKAEAALSKGEKIDAGWYDRTCVSNIVAVPRVEARADDPAMGPKDARVTVIEFSDFQCPYCSQAVPVVKGLEKSFGKEVRVVWKHLPLSFHPNALPAALAAEAAREQGKFWEMHDRLFANQATLNDATFERQAKELGLDMKRFKDSLAAPQTRQRVEADLALATAAGVNGTPTFLVNGEQVVGSGALQDAVKRQLEKTKSARN